MAAVSPNEDSSLTASSSNGSNSNGSTSTGRTSTESTSNGSTITGSTSTGSTSNGSTSTGSTITGSTSNGSTSTGSTSNGSTSTGSTSNGSNSNVSNSNVSTSSTEQRACDTPDCRVGKLISVVPKRKTTQFVTVPSLQQKPILVNGLTSVFQVSGSPAKLSDIKVATNFSNDEPDTLKPIFRVKPDSHVHIINYIVVDDDSDVVRKITENDSDTMRILLESQRVSAEAKLQKLMANHAPVDINAVVTKKTAYLDGGTSIIAFPSILEMPVTTNTSPVQETQPTTTTQAPSTVTQTSQAPSIATQTSLTPPLEAQAQATNFGLSIASVAEGVPFISPVPLNTLQAPAATEPATAKPPEQELSTTAISKMQEELKQLRRTVAQLAAQSQTK